MFLLQARVVQRSKESLELLCTEDEALWTSNANPHTKSTVHETLDRPQLCKSSI